MIYLKKLLLKNEISKQRFTDFARVEKKEGGLAYYKLVGVFLF